MPATRDTLAGSRCLGAVIREHRERNGLALDVVAERIGVRASTLEAYEADGSHVPERMVAKLADALGVDPVQFERDCLFHVRPQLADSSFGKLIDDMLDDDK